MHKSLEKRIDSLWDKFNSNPFALIAISKLEQETNMKKKAVKKSPKPVQLKLVEPKQPEVPMLETKVFAGEKWIRFNTTIADSVYIKLSSIEKVVPFNGKVQIWTHSTGTEVINAMDSILKTMSNG